MDDIRRPRRRPTFINDFGGPAPHHPRREPHLARIPPKPRPPVQPTHSINAILPPPTTLNRPPRPAFKTPDVNTHTTAPVPTAPTVTERTRQPFAPSRRPRLGDKATKPRFFSWQRLKAVPRKKLVIRSIIALIILILLPGGWVGWKLYRNVSKVTHNNNPLNLLSAFHPVPLKNHNGRVNILVAGISDDRTDGGGGGNLTDSIMVLSLDTTNHTAFMLSIPRDLWINIPGMGYQKINAANTVSSFSQDGYPKGGIGDLEKVVYDNLNITTDYYAIVNYTAFRDAVNAVGGVTVNIQSTDPRGLYDPQPYGGAKSFKLPNGVQTLNGDMALNLARARGDAYGSYGFPNSDFDRTAHQRQLVLALKDKSSSTSVIANPFKIGELADAMGNNIQTDMKLNEMETLFTVNKQINDANIQSFSINDLVSGKTLLKNYTTASGQEALIPAMGVDDFSQIQASLKKLFSSNPVEKEGANVVVLNGGNINGLAAQESQILTQKGMNVAATASAPKPYATNTIVDESNGQKPQTLKLLQSMFGANVVKSDPGAANYTADFVVILGQNQAAPSSSSGN